MRIDVPRVELELGTHGMQHFLGQYLACLTGSVELSAESAVIGCYIDCLVKKAPSLLLSTAEGQG